MAQPKTCFFIIEITVMEKVVWGKWRKEQCAIGRSSKVVAMFEANKLISPSSLNDILKVSPRYIWVARTNLIPAVAICETLLGPDISAQRHKLHRSIHIQ